MSYDVKMPEDVLALPEGQLMDCVPTKKHNEMVRVCHGARAGCIGAAVLILAAAFMLPAMFRSNGPATAWLAMALEAGAFGMLRAARWITRHVL